MIEQLDFVTLNVFTTHRYAGNPLAVVLLREGQDLETERMQVIAREFNLSETVFLYEQATHSVGPEWRFRIFTTKQELTFAGHPTIGTASYLFTRLMHAVQSFSLVCKAGRVLCEAGVDDKGRLLPSFATDVQSAASRVNNVRVPHDFHIHATIVKKDRVTQLQDELREDVIGSVDLVSPVRGMTFLLVELTNSDALALVKVSGMAPDFKLDQGWDFGFLGTAFYVKNGAEVAPNSGAGGAVYHRYNTRMIETQMEDPATGSMSCGLAALLALRAHRGFTRHDFVLTQGVQMGRESNIGVQVVLDDTRSSIESITLRGHAVPVMAGSIRV